MFKMDHEHMHAFQYSNLHAFVLDYCKPRYMYQVAFHVGYTKDL